MIGLLYMVLLLAVSILAFRYAEFEYRAACAVMAIGSISSGFVYVLGSQDWNGGIVTILLIDCAAAVIFVVLALRSDRFWPLWMAGFQIGALASHLTTYVAADAVPYAMGVLQGFWAWFQLGVLLGIGLVQGQRMSKMQ